MLQDYGVTIDEPAGWNKRIVKVIAPVVSPVMVHAATVPFAADDYSFYQTATCSTFEPGDAALIAIVYDPVPSAQVWPPSVIAGFTDLAFGIEDYTSLQGLPPGQIQARRVVTIQNRVCEIVACFGTSNPAAPLLQTVASALTTLAVSANAAKEATGDGQEIALQMSLA